MENDKVRENRLRNAAKRQGLLLSKSRRRDPRALDYDRYMLVGARGSIVAGGGPFGFSLSLDEVEQWLTEDK